MNNSNEVLVTVKISRGGRFNNPGHKSVIATEMSITDYIEDLFFDEKENTLTDGGGNELEFEFNENGTGYINIDNGYDTVIVSLLSEFTEDEFYLIAESNEYNKVELLESLGVKNAKVLEAFNLLEEACKDLFLDLDEHYITEVSEEAYESSDYGFHNYEENNVDGVFYVRELN